ncbi:MAG: three-Cys-motif partner protein TcmP, partial [Anaerolineales bacterium]
MPDSTLWALEPHTTGKHKVLRGYLDAWFPILGTWSGRILFIDGFAGPGEYRGGEQGSPQIALDALLKH